MPQARGALAGSLALWAGSREALKPPESPGIDPGALGANQGVWEAANGSWIESKARWKLSPRPRKQKKVFGSLDGGNGGVRSRPGDILPSMDLREHLGNIDIYLVDQLLKERLVPGMSLLDAGCGGGRNLIWFLRQGYEVAAVDESSEAVEQVRRLAGSLAPHLPPESFQVADLEALPFPSARFDAVLCSAVLHFARDEEHFDRMLDEMWRVLRPGGLFFARLASTIGLEKRVQALEGRRFLLPDGTRWFLVDAGMLQRTTERLGGTWLDPLKTTVVEDLRAMTTWVLRKPR